MLVGGDRMTYGMTGEGDDGGDMGQRFRPQRVGCWILNGVSGDMIQTAGTAKRIDPSMPTTRMDIQWRERGYVEGRGGGMA